MGNDVLERHFAKMGARLNVRPLVGSTRRGAVRVNVLHDRRGEYFDIEASQDVQLDVIDVRPKVRHLLLLARLDGRKDKFVCGHDERAWFVAAVPERESAADVRSALESLKPGMVRRLEERLNVRYRDRLARRNEAFVRQGEWFFTPADLNPPAWLILRNEPLRRGLGSKPHMVEEVFREGGETVYVCRRHPRGVSEVRYHQIMASTPTASTWNWTPMRRNPWVYARGRVSHSDHKTVVLRGWHRVQMNTENQSRAMAHVAFLD